MAFTLIRPSSTRTRVQRSQRVFGIKDKNTNEVKKYVKTENDVRHHVQINYDGYKNDERRALKELMLEEYGYLLTNRAKRKYKRWIRWEERRLNNVKAKPGAATNVTNITLEVAPVSDHEHQYDIADNCMICCKNRKVLEQ